MGRGKEVEKIRGEKHESSEEKHISGEKKSSLNFIKRGQLHYDILGEGRNTKKEDKPKEKLLFVSYKNHIVIFRASHCWTIIQVNWGTQPKTTHTYI